MKQVQEEKMQMLLSVTFFPKGYIEEKAFFYFLTFWTCDLLQSPPFLLFLILTKEKKCDAFCIFIVLFQIRFFQRAKPHLREKN